MNTVVTVLRSGGEFNATHVQAMQRQVTQWGPTGTRFVCLSDVPVEGVETIPLLHKWPGWWAKIELFRPDIKGDFLFTDLDNVIVGPMDDLFNRGFPQLQHNGWTALMWLPEWCRRSVWDLFVNDPVHWMEFYAQANRPVLNGVGNYGDAGFISGRLREFATWEEELPGQVINIVSLMVRTILGKRWLHSWPEDTRMILCGGPKHRPWNLPMFWKLRLYGENI